MSLAVLLNIPSVENPESFSYFSFHNNDGHRLTVEAISTQRGIELDIFPLDPIPFFSFEGWLIIHQQSHNQINGVLGVDGVDLSSVDFSDQEQAATWVRLHFSEHNQWSQILGVS